jgi:hypothetical protein
VTLPALVGCRSRPCCLVGSPKAGQQQWQGAVQFPLPVVPLVGPWAVGVDRDRDIQPVQRFTKAVFWGYRYCSIPWASVLVSWGPGCPSPKDTNRRVLRSLGARS